MSITPQSGGSCNRAATFSRCPEQVKTAMTEADWLACADPRPMLHFLRWRADDRKLRLFACACCRLVWEHLPGMHCRRAVELGERYADDLLGEPEREAARRELNRGIARERGARGRLAQAAEQVLRARFSPTLVAERARTGRGAHLLARRQCALLRDLFSPFRRSRGDSTWLTWREGTIPKIARTIYDDRAFERLPILADALEEAGCTEAAVLDHLRGPGPHVPGCWVVDLLLGKE
jgi:hypothetical protein